MEHAYSLRGCILDVLRHTTAWDQNRGGDEIVVLKLIIHSFALLSTTLVAAEMVAAVVLE